MNSVIALKILTGEGLFLSDEAVSVVVPGSVGYLGVLRGHAPLVTTLKPGKLSFRKKDGIQRSVTLGDGLMEVSKNVLTILTSSASENLPVHAASA